jgi:excisionase family DNA binding protein
MTTDAVDNDVIDDDKIFLTPKEVCERLNVTPRWLRRQQELGKLQRYKLGKLIRYDKTDVDNYIESCRIPAGQA